MGKMYCCLMDLKLRTNLDDLLNLDINNLCIIAILKKEIKKIISKNIN